MGDFEGPQELEVGLGDFDGLKFSAGAAEAAGGFHTAVGEPFAGVEEFDEEREGFDADAVEAEVDLKFVLVVCGGFIAAGAGDAWPTEYGCVVGAVHDVQADGAEEFMLGLFHPAEEIGEVSDASEVGVGEFDTAGGDIGLHSELPRSQGGRRSN